MPGLSAKGNIIENKSRKRIAMYEDTETEESVTGIPGGERKRKKKSRKTTDEVNLLSLNNQMAAVDSGKGLQLKTEKCMITFRRRAHQRTHM